MLSWCWSGITSTSWGRDPPGRPGAALFASNTAITEVQTSGNNGGAHRRGQEGATVGGCCGLAIITIEVGSCLLLFDLFCHSGVQNITLNPKSNKRGWRQKKEVVVVAKETATVIKLMRWGQ
jgi:hypothetical protein